MSGGTSSEQGALRSDLQLGSVSKHHPDSWCYGINLPSSNWINQGKSLNFTKKNWLWGTILIILICRLKIKLFLSDYSFCSAYPAQQSLSCHSAQFLCLPSFVTTPDKTLYILFQHLMKCANFMPICTWRRCRSCERIVLHFHALNLNPEHCCSAGQWFFFSIACWTWNKIEGKLENPHLNIMLETCLTKTDLVSWPDFCISLFIPPKCWAAHLHSPNNSMITDISH